MMWTGTYEPLYVERLAGKSVDFFWKQEGAHHFIKAQWRFGPEPWSVKSCETSNTQRHLAIPEATQKITELIQG